MYGRLQYIFAFELPAIENVTGIPEPKTMFLAGITQCKITRKHRQLDINYYETESKSVDILDIACVQCLVGRVKSEGSTWAIIDRSGALARAVWDEEQGEQ